MMIGRDRWQGRSGPPGRREARLRAAARDGGRLARRCQMRAARRRGFTGRYGNLLNLRAIYGGIWNFTVTRDISPFSLAPRRLRGGLRGLRGHVHISLFRSRRGSEGARVARRCAPCPTVSPPRSPDRSRLYGDAWLYGDACIFPRCVDANIGFSRPRPSAPHPDLLPARAEKGRVRGHMHISPFSLAPAVRRSAAPGVAPLSYRFAAARIGPQPSPCTMAASARPGSLAPARGKLAASPRQWPMRTISRTTSL